MSLFDPLPGESAHIEFMQAGGSPVSGEPLPSLRAKAVADLESKLRVIAIRIARSTDRSDGWEDAYNTLAEALSASGKLTERQLAYDLPNVIFNYAVRNGWFPYLVPLSKESKGLLNPNRLDEDGYCERSRSPMTKQESLAWFKDRIRPAVMEWTNRIMDSELRFRTFRDTMVLKSATIIAAGTEAQKPAQAVVDPIQGTIERRQRLLADYKKRVLHPEKGRPYSDSAIYNCRFHTAHKPEFMKWKSGRLSDENPATISLERFLRGDQHPVPRKTR